MTDTPKTAAVPPVLAAGQTWRSPKAHWRIRCFNGQSVLIYGPRGCIRTSRDGGETWSELGTTMTTSGFLAWIRKTGAVLDA